MATPRYLNCKIVPFALYANKNFNFFFNLTFHPNSKFQFSFSSLSLSLSSFHLPNASNIYSTDCESQCAASLNQIIKKNAEKFVDFSFDVVV